MSTAETTNQELVLAASLMARPEFVHALYPPSLTGGADLRSLENPVARAAIDILGTGGEAYAAPNAMRAALADLPIEFNEEDIFALCTLIPAPWEVELPALQQMKETVERVFGQRQLRREVLGVAQDLKSKQADDAVARLEAAIRAYRQGNVGKDVSTKGILERMREGQVAVRWKCGCSYLDEQDGAKGIGPKGEFISGILAQTEVVVMTAWTGTGKTRMLYNWLNALIDQGAVVELLVGEDNEATYSVKLLATRLDIEKWKIEQFIYNQTQFANVYGTAEATVIGQGVEWYYDINKQLYIHDGRSKVNIFKFPAAKGLLEEMVALHGSTHVAVDYVQIWKGDTPTLEGYAQEMREFSARNNVGLILLSQIPNEAKKYGVTPGMLPAKGTGDWGQIAHFGYLLEQDPLVGQKELRIIQVKGRDTGTDMVYAHFNVATGKITGYSGVPTDMRSPDEPKESSTRRSRK